jgi:hypothetical protein
LVPAFNNTTDGTNVWTYSSADAAATVAGASYFSNGVALGMKLNDLVIVIDTATPLITSHRAKTIGATAVTLSAGTTIGAT